MSVTSQAGDQGEACYLIRLPRRGVPYPLWYTVDHSKWPLDEQVLTLWCWRSHAMRPTRIPPTRQQSANMPASSHAAADDHHADSGGRTSSPGANQSTTIPSNTSNTSKHGSNSDKKRSGSLPESRRKTFEERATLNCTMPIGDGNDVFELASLSDMPFTPWLLQHLLAPTRKLPTGQRILVSAAQDVAYRRAVAIVSYWHHALQQNVRDLDFAFWSRGGFDNGDHKLYHELDGALATVIECVRHSPHTRDWVRAPEAGTRSGNAMGIRASLPDRISMPSAGVGDTQQAVPCSLEPPSRVKQRERAHALERERLRYHKVIGRIKKFHTKRIPQPSATIKITIGTTASHYKAIVAQAEAAQLSVSNFVYLQVLGRLREPPPQVLVALPPRIPAEHARPLIDLATTIDFVVRAWIAATKSVASGDSLDTDEHEHLREQTELCIETLTTMSPV